MWSFVCFYVFLLVLLILSLKDRIIILFPLLSLSHSHLFSTTWTRFSSRDHPRFLCISLSLSFSLSFSPFLSLFLSLCYSFSLSLSLSYVLSDVNMCRLLGELFFLSFSRIRFLFKSYSRFSSSFSPISC